MVDRTALVADCARCSALCCVAPAFARSSEFALDKPPGVPCPHLGDDFGCTIHAELRPRGFAGCATYDCFGAGQRVTQQTFDGTTWRDAPERAGEVFAVLPVVRALHELLWFLTEATTLVPTGELGDALRVATARTEEQAEAPAAVLLALDVDAHRDTVVPLLRRASERARAGTPAAATDLSGEDLSGRDLRRTELRGAALRGTVLIGADLRGVDLSSTDLTGADLRGADLAGAGLASALFLTRLQVGGARGDRATTLPDWLPAPDHWRHATTGGPDQAWERLAP